MRTPDWRDLYAANRETIEAARWARARELPALETRLAKLGVPGIVAPDDHAPASGAWEHRFYDGVGGTREYFLYIPPDLHVDDDTPLLVLLHGCTQSAAGLARATRMNAAADRFGYLVAYPQQAEHANPQRCWNWFLATHQTRGAGESAIVAGITQDALSGLGHHGASKRRPTFLAGMSAGGAMAAVVGAAYPDLFDAIGIHSGLPYGAATSQAAAFAALARGVPDPRVLGRLAFGAMGRSARILPAIVVHGTADPVVAPINGDQLVEQWLVTNHLAAPSDFDGTPALPHEILRTHAPGGHGSVTSRWKDRRDRTILEYVKVEGLAHAWSGGARAAFSDPRGPAASELLLAFFTNAIR
jgi:poly(hydroxyalkanoate) depolymerase family esterase